MAEQFLSQDEIDALLEGPERKPEPSEQQDATGKPRSYDLARQERIVRGRMPTLELIHERFARHLRLGLFNFMRRNPVISSAPINVGKYSAFLNDLVVPSNINVMQVLPLHGTALLIIEPRLVFSIIDIMFGGSGRHSTRIEGREFSNTEQRIIRRAIELISAEYQRAWEGVYPLRLEYTRSEMQPQFANVATPAEIVVTARFDIDLGDQGGAILLCVPYVVLEPIREILYSPLSANPQSQNRRWYGVLSNEIQPATVELRAEVAQANVTVGELMELRKGDVVEIDLEESARLMTGHLTLCRGRYGESAGRYAVRVDEILSDPKVTKAE